MGRRVVGNEEAKVPGPDHTWRERLKDFGLCSEGDVGFWDSSEQNRNMKGSLRLPREEQVL